MHSLMDAVVRVLVGLAVFAGIVGVVGLVVYLEARHSGAERLPPAALPLIACLTLGLALVAGISAAGAPAVGLPLGIVGTVVLSGWFSRRQLQLQRRPPSHQTER